MSKKLLSLLLVLLMLLPLSLQLATAEEEIPTIRVLYTKGGFEAPPENDPIKARRKC